MSNFMFFLSTYDFMLYFIFILYIFINTEIIFLIFAELIFN